LAVEPKKEFLLPWLDPDNNDDRLLAGSIEVMRLRPRSPVILVSRDINLQNKAEFAQVPFVEPPEPI
jgi:predicted ribonuclease YlaK